MTTHALFAGHHYYPGGGMNDLCAQGSVDELKLYFKRHKQKIAGDSYIDNWGQIVCIGTFEVFEECDRWGGNGDPLWVTSA